MEFSLTDLLLYLFSFHLKPQNSLSRARPYSKWESILMFHRILTVTPITHGYICLSNYTMWFIFIPSIKRRYFKGLRLRRFFKGNLYSSTLFHHIIPVSSVLWSFRGFKARVGPSGLVSVIFTSTQQLPIVHLGALPSATPQRWPCPNVTPSALRWAPQPSPHWALPSDLMAST